jgi:hypothetical protein
MSRRSQKSLAVVPCSSRSRLPLKPRITAVETALAAASDHADRERRAGALEAQMATVSPLFDQWLEVSGRFVQELAKLHGVFDAQNGALLVRQCRDGLEGARYLEWVKVFESAAQAPRY